MPPGSASPRASRVGTQEDQLDRAKKGAPRPSESNWLGGYESQEDGTQLSIISTKQVRTIVDDPLAGMGMCLGRSPRGETSWWSVRGEKRGNNM